MVMIPTVICRPNNNCIIDDYKNTFLQFDDLLHSLLEDLTV